MTTEPLYNKLKALRIAHGYTQDYVASTLGIIRQTYSHYETGRRIPSSEALYKLSSLYNITIDELVQYAINPKEGTYYNAPSTEQSKDILTEFVNYFNQPTNKQKYKLFNDLEKELLFYFNKISEKDKKEIIEFTKIKSEKTK